jgi:hypothetical protein
MVSLAYLVGLLSAGNFLREGKYRSGMSILNGNEMCLLVISFGIGYKLIYKQSF